MEQSEHYINRVTMAFDDLLYCYDFLEKQLSYEAGEEPIIQLALTSSFIIAYGRVFGSSNTKDQEYKEVVSTKFGVLLNRWKRKLSSELLEFHNSLISKRNIAIAHSDAVSRDYKVSTKNQVSFGYNPYTAFSEKESEIAFELTKSLLTVVSCEHSKCKSQLDKANT
ncbi:hypothetical protein KW432_21925 [Vibrio fluvialis]|uniref:hypothetical protein n=1 Tax=Vibrio TaxID=662 RepID=UPI0019D439A3|nr:MULTISPECIES: hypothetical protein [Vibrio]MBY7890564.1 hypothetical protein [Vibrio fluvialis]MCA2476884.1 hypothetical protein [Vibrio alginolyticus]MDF4666617.1 hypothetical protein [Vibrio parahaemolyticus]MBN8112548.1 hypothetical protein [Vibrio vulnificus]MDF4765398.1 hypothetical protein [Vibrio parahaemolyticus]